MEVILAPCTIFSHQFFLIYALIFFSSGSTGLWWVHLKFLSQRTETKGQGNRMLATSFPKLFLVAENEPGMVEWRGTLKMT